MSLDFLRLGLSHDRRKLTAYHDEEYYRWVQWVFIILFRHGLAYRRNADINWCPSCESSLADSLVEDGQCWRCGTAVEVRQTPQWFIREADFAEDLLAGLERLNGWPARIKSIHRAWIGRRSGLSVQFSVSAG